MRDRDYDGQNVPEQVKEQAELAGTWGKIHRDPQYSGPERARPEALLKSHNEQWNQLRALQAEKGRIEAELAETKRQLERAKIEIWILSLIVSPIIAIGVKTLLGMVR